MRSPTSQLLALAALATGCAPEVPFEDKVGHLDLRMADGSSPASRLASSQVLWNERLEIEGPGTDLGSWATQYCRVDPAAQGARGISLSGVVPDGARMRRIELRSSRTYVASEIDFLELDVARTSAGIARVSWRCSTDELLPIGFPRAATAIVPESPGVSTVRIPLNTQPGWAGEITELAIAPKEDGVQRVDVLALRLGRVGFTTGPDVLESTSPGGVQGSDGGLIALGREARRAFPSDWNVPLFARAHVPRGGRLSLEAGVASNTINLTAEVRFRVDARARDTDAWQRVGSTSIVPGMRSQGPAWEHVSASLAAFEGKEIELRFLANDAGEPDQSGTLDRARLFWGEPLVLGAQGPAPRPNVILITLDTVRADALGAQRPGEASPTPFLDALAARGMVFEDAWSACNATSPSHASLMTGLAVQDHGLLDNRSRLAAENTTLAEAFRAGGWQTAAAVSVPHLTPAFSGLGQGFDRFWLGQADSAMDGAKTVAAVREWWRAFAREGPRPTFLWLHLFDAHTPYEVPQWFLEEFAERMRRKVPSRQAAPRSLPTLDTTGTNSFLAGVTNREWPDFVYRACVAYEDELLRQLFTELAPRGTADNAFIAVIADHGEALGEHDNWYTHAGLYREVMHVPLIVCAPGALRGVHVEEPVWSLDLSRTLFKLSGQPVPPETRGLDLLEFALAHDRPRRRIFFEHSRLPQVGCVDGERSAILTRLDFAQFGPSRRIPAGTLQLFDARRDPGETQELRGAAEEDAKYRALFQQWTQSALNRTRVPSELSEEEEARLRQLGY